METIRQITNAISPVPAPIATTPSTFTSVGGKLVYAGSDDLRLTLNKYANVWLWFPNSNKLYKIESYGEFGAYIPTRDADLSSGGAEAGHIVKAVLTYYELTNVSGSGAATVDGANLNAGFPLLVGIPGRSGAKPVCLDAVLVDATNSDVRVLEQQ